MLDRSEIRRMIAEEVEAAREEAASRRPMRLTRDSLRRIVMEEAAAFKASAQRQDFDGMMITPKLSLVEALMGSDEGQPGMIYSTDDEGHNCAECGAMYEMPVAKCEQCGASMQEYVSRGMTNFGKTATIEERKRHGMKSKPVPHDPDAFKGMSRSKAKKAVDKMSRKPGPTFDNVVDAAEEWADEPEAAAAKLMRQAGMEPARGPSRKRSKNEG